MRRLLTWLLPALMAGLLPGCGRSLRAVPENGQISIGDDRGILEKRGRVAVLVRPRSIPWDHDERLIAFTVEITNYRDQPLAVSPTRFALLDQDRNQRRAVDPNELQRAFESATTEADAGVPRRLRGALAVGVGIGTGRHRVYYDRGYGHYGHRYYRHRRRHYYYAYPYGGYWYYGWGPYRHWYYDSGYNEQLARERIAQFLAELWREGELQPKEVAAGHIIFTHHLAKHETLTLRLDLDPPGDEQEARDPAAAKPLRFEFHFEVK